MISSLFYGDWLRDKIIINSPNVILFWTNLFSQRYQIFYVNEMKTLE